MTTDSLTLQGRYVRLEPLGHQHVDGLVRASVTDPSFYRWSPVPQGKDEAARYIDTALAWRDAGTAVPFAIVRVEEGSVAVYYRGERIGFQEMAEPVREVAESPAATHLRVPRKAKPDHPWRLGYETRMATRNSLAPPVVLRPSASP